MSRVSLRTAATAAVASAMTTVLLWVLPLLVAAPASFEDTLLLHDNALYLARLWVNFIHIFLALTAYGAAAAVLWRRSPALAGFGFLWLVLWGFVELIGVVTNLLAVNLTWRAQFASSSAEVQSQLRVLLLGFQGVWNALFLLLLTGFLLGTTMLGLAAARGKGLERWVGYLLLLGAPLTLAIMVGGYTSLTVFDSAVGWVYPIVQPTGRALLGLWLWRAAGQLDVSSSEGDLA